MKRLTRAQLAQRDALAERLREAAEKIGPAIEAVNDFILQYNNVLADVETWRDEVVSEMEEYEGERSERWHDSDAASEFQGWKSEFESLDASTVEQIESPSLEHADAIEGLPESADQ